MTVVPGVSVLKSAPSVRELISLSNGTLSDTIHTIHLVCVELPDTMPVNCGSVLVVSVSHVDHKLVSPTRLYQRCWEGIIEDFACRFLEPIGCELPVHRV